ncbi:tRNA (adenosine(37)-N6)-threonylcarbamoyltransferase complex ATPase subunit type 1 TsaE [Candidatus Cloacimonadota bacterium]
MKSKWEELFGEYELDSEQDTIDLAKRIAARAKAGDILALYGELGAGKTFFTQHLCRYLGIEDIVSSPSYVLINLYRGRLPVTHADLYRLSSMEEVMELGLDEMFADRLTVIEWPEIADELLPVHTLHIKFKFLDKSRKAILTG